MGTRSEILLPCIRGTAATGSVRLVALYTPHIIPIWYQTHLEGLSLIHI